MQSAWLGLAYCTHHQIAAAVLKKASAPELFFRQGSENKKFLRQIIDLDGRLQDWRYKMRRVLSQRKNVSHNGFCPANVFEFSKPIHCTETRSYDAALLASSSLDSLKRVGSAAADRELLTPATTPEARAQKSNDSTRQLIDLRNAVTAKTANFCTGLT